MSERPQKDGRGHGAMLEAVLGRDRSLFEPDVERHTNAIRERLEGRRILVTGAAGSIGAATVRQLARYAPARLAAVDLSENNLVELVRDLRSRPDLDPGDALRTFVTDFGSDLGARFLEAEGPFDLILHFAALKHVRSERDVFSLCRLIETNVLGVDRFLGAAKRLFPCDIFAISTDKACRPANFMGASKRLMESVVAWHSQQAGSILGGGDADPLRRVASTRFANVAFSDGSLLAGFLRRLEKRQPLAGPSDVRRYFISESEAGQLCMLTAALAETRQVFVPRRDPQADARRFDEIAEIVLRASGFEPHWYESFEAATAGLSADLAAGRYPCCFTTSDTSGEKDLEEFVAPDETLAESRFDALDVIAESPDPGPDTIADVVRGLAEEASHPDPASSHARIAELLKRAVPAFQHIQTGKNLDQKA